MATSMDRKMITYKHPSIDDDADENSTLINLNPLPCRQWRPHHRESAQNGGRHEAADPFLTVEHVRARNRQEVIDKGLNYTRTTILVGERHTPFYEKTASIKKYRYLSDRLHATVELKSHINLYEETDISAEDFTPIHEFLLSGDFQPRFVGRGTDQVEDTILHEQKDIAAEKISLVFLTASKLHMGDLQDLCVRKLKAMQPLSMQALMIAVKCEKMATQENERGNELEEWLIQCVAGYLCDVLETGSLTLSRLMQEYPEFERAVLAKAATL